MQYSEQILYCDGSYVNNRGGYGIVHYYQETDSYFSWGDKVYHAEVTNNIAELSGLYFCLKYILERPYTAIKWIMRSDSKYSIQCITDWSENWERNGWKTATGKDVKNKELIVQILYFYRELLSRRNIIEFQHVKAHSGEKYNEICDQIAKYYSSPNFVSNPPVSIEIILAIVGCRKAEMAIYPTIKYYIDDYIQKNGRPQKIISGGAKGIDSMAKRYSEENSILFQEYQANWN